VSKRKEDAEGLELTHGERKLSDEFYGRSDKNERKAEDIIQCESEMNHHDMVRGMLNGIVDTVVQGMPFRMCRPRGE
jgi:hypothetical protein